MGCRTASGPTPNRKLPRGPGGSGARVAPTLWAVATIPSLRRKGQTVRELTPARPHETSLVKVGTEYGRCQSRAGGGSGRLARASELGPPGQAVPEVRSLVRL